MLVEECQDGFLIELALGVDAQGNLNNKGFPIVCKLVEIDVNLDFTSLAKLGAELEDRHHCEAKLVEVAVNSLRETVVDVEMELDVWVKVD
jgi:hypothetical protein